MVGILVATGLAAFALLGVAWLWIDRWYEDASHIGRDRLLIDIAASRFERMDADYTARWGEDPARDMYTFSEALEALLTGSGPWARAAWPDGEFIFLVPGSTFNVNRPPLLGLYPDGTRIKYRGHLDLVAEDGTVGMWTPTQESLMAEDWFPVTVHD
jgi:hypothetical protein